MLTGKEAEKTCDKILKKGCGDNFKWSKPFVKGYFKEGKQWLGFDNTTAELWIETFNLKRQVLEWLSGVEVEDIT